MTRAYLIAPFIMALAAAGCSNDNGGCKSDSDCPIKGYVCDTGTGLCKKPTTNPDGGGADDGGTGGDDGGMMEQPEVTTCPANNNCIWFRDLPNAGIGEDMPGTMAVDKAGNIIVAGGFKGDFKPGKTTFSSAGGMDIFLAKYKSDGTHIWSKRIGGPGIDYATSIAVDSAGTIALTGFIAEGADIGGGAQLSGRRIFVATFSADGNVVWSKAFPAWTNAPQLPNTRYAPQVAISSDTVYLLSHFTGVANLGGNDLVAPNGLQPGVLIASLNSATGAHKTSKYLGQHDYGTNLQIAVASDASVWLAGDLPGGANIDLGGGKLSIAADGAFIARLNAAGAVQFSKTFVQVTSRALALDGTGAGLWVGSFRGTPDFGNGAISGNANAENGFVAKLNSNGSAAWSKAQASVALAQNRAVVADGGSDVVISGRYQSSINFGADNKMNLGTPLMAAKYGAAAGALSYGDFVTTLIPGGYAESVGITTGNVPIILASVKQGQNPVEKLSIFAFQKK